MWLSLQDLCESLPITSCFLVSFCFWFWVSFWDNCTVLNLLTNFVMHHPPSCFCIFVLQKVWLATSLCCLRSGDLVGTVMIVTMGVTKTTTAATLRSQSVWTLYVTQDSQARAVSRCVFIIYPFRCDKTENIAVSCSMWPNQICLFRIWWRGLSAAPAGLP